MEAKELREMSAEDFVETVLVARIGVRALVLGHDSHFGKDRRGDFELARRAIRAGCLFALDSDAHSTAELSYAETAIAHARLAGVPTDRVVNTWSLDRLLEWCSAAKTR